MLPRLQCSYGLMRQSSTLLVPRLYPQHQVCAGCCQPRLGGGPSRRCSTHLSLRAWTSTPAAREVHLPVTSSTTSAFPAFGPGRRSATSVQRLQYGAFFEAAVIHSCSGPQVCSPPRSLLPLRRPSVGQPWFFRPSLSWVVTSPRPGYACRPNRAIDGRGLSPHKMCSLVGCFPVAVRTPVTRRPPHRSRRAVFPHRAPQ